MGGPASGLNPKLPDDLTFRAVLSKGGIERLENRVGKPLTDMTRAARSANQETLRHTSHACTTF